jgi:ATP-dependent protease Clp ATPase subunit
VQHALLKIVEGNVVNVPKASWQKAWSKTASEVRLSHKCVRLQIIGTWPQESTRRLLAD